MAISASANILSLRYASAATSYNRARSDTPSMYIEHTDKTFLGLLLTWFLAQLAATDMLPTSSDCLSIVYNCQEDQYVFLFCHCF